MIVCMDKEARSSPNCALMCEASSVAPLCKNARAGCLLTPPGQPHGLAASCSGILIVIVLRAGKNQCCIAMITWVMTNTGRGC